MNDYRGINFGCGLRVADKWKNYDASPTLWLQRLPVLGIIARQLISPRFPASALYGDVVRGLPEVSETADWVYCSHVLEHMSLDDFRKSLNEVMRLLKPGGVFRGVLPDLEAEVQKYLLDSSDMACSKFMEMTGLGIKSRSRGLGGILRGFLGHRQHLWMWDYKGLREELIRVGFNQVRQAHWQDSPYPVFHALEEQRRWEGCLGFECIKPV